MQSLLRLNRNLLINDEQVMWWSDFQSAARVVLARWGTPNLAETRRSLGEQAECQACHWSPTPHTRRELLNLANEIDPPVT